MSSNTPRARKHTAKNDQSDDDFSLKDLMKSVIKIYCCHATPNFAMPWQIKRQETSTSSGFVISGNRILCNAHGIAYGSNVQVRKHGNSKKYFAKVAHVGHECDLAVLTVDDEAFWDDLSALELGDVPELQDKVFVVGYPTGGDDICVTEGVVSRVGVAEYAHSGEALLTIQIDAAINSGNSGGPAFCGSKVTGVAFESLDNCDNIGFIIPTPVIRHFLHDIDTEGGYKGFPLLNIYSQMSENKSMREYTKIPPLSVLVRAMYPTHPLTQHIPAPATVRESETEVDVCINGVVYTVPRSLVHSGKTQLPGPLQAYLQDKESDDGSVGMRVSRVMPLTHVSEQLRAGDIILCFDHTPVASNSTVVFRGRERVAFSHILTSKFVGDKGHILIVRGNRLMVLDPQLQKRRELVRWRHFTQTPSYFVFMGMVFLVLSAPYLESEFGPKWERHSPMHMMGKLNSGTLKQKSLDEQVVVLSHILVSEHNMGYEEEEHQLVEKVNGVDVVNLHHLAEMICSFIESRNTCDLEMKDNNSDSDFLRLELSNGSEIVLNVNDCQQKHVDILLQHQIPSPGASADLRAPFQNNTQSIGDSNSNDISVSVPKSENADKKTSKTKSTKLQHDEVAEQTVKRKRV